MLYYYACEIVRKENAQFTFAPGMWMILKIFQPRS
jgi:hypothetical protein